MSRGVRAALGGLKGIMQSGPSHVRFRYLSPEYVVCTGMVPLQFVEPP